MDRAKRSRESTLSVKVSPRRGELWQLGPHRLLCGDATNAGDVGRLMDGATPHLMVTDPPYGVAYQPDWRKKVMGKRRHAGAAITGDDRFDWTAAWELFQGDVAYVWHASRSADLVARTLRDQRFTIRSHIVWAKPHFVISRGHYHWQHEACYYAVRKGRTGHWQGDRKQSTLWAMPLARHERSQLFTGHAAQKPLEAMARPIRNNSRPGELVYDPFLGSGTTIIAAEREGRICYGLEVDPVCCGLIIERWRRETGQEPRRI